MYALAVSSSYRAYSCIRRSVVMVRYEGRGMVVVVVVVVGGGVIPKTNNTSRMVVYVLCDGTSSFCFMVFYPIY